MNLRGLWKNLDVYSNSEFGATVEMLAEFVKDKEDRNETVLFVEKRLQNPSVDHRDQLRLGFLVNALKYKAPRTDESTIQRLVNMGCRHLDYYGMVLTPEPITLPISIQVFKCKEDLVAYGFNPDGSKKHRYVVQEMVLALLVQSTNEDFGRDYDKWRIWWDSEGQYMDFDWDKGVYKKKK